MLTKAVTIGAKQMKAGPSDGLGENEFKAYVATFGNIDSYGDVIKPDAFDQTVAEWKASGDPMPIIWSHQYADLDNHIGYAIDLTPDQHGLLVHGKLDSSADDAKARKAYQLMKGRRLRQFSFTYDVLDGAPADLNGEQVFELRRLKLYEAGPCLIGVNQETELVGIKALQQITQDIKSGRVLSAKNEEILRGARDAIDEVLSTLEDSNSTGKAADVPVKVDESAGMKAEEPNRSAAVELALATVAEVELLLGV